MHTLRYAACLLSVNKPFMLNNNNPEVVKICPKFPKIVIFHYLIIVRAISRKQKGLEMRLWSHLKALDLHLGTFGEIPANRKWSKWRKM